MKAYAACIVIGAVIGMAIGWQSPDPAEPVVHVVTVDRWYPTDDEDRRVERLTRAMVAWARHAEHHDAGDRAERYARAIVRAVDDVPGVVDEYTLAALGWTETRWRKGLVSSAGACGPWQIMPAEVLGGARPTCAEAQSVYAGAVWALRHLDSRRGELGEVRPCRYLGNCMTEHAVDYERRVWRAANWMRVR